MSRVNQSLLVVGGVLIGVLAVKAFEAPAAHAQTAGAHALAVSGDAAWTVAPNGAVRRCVMQGNFVTCRGE